MQLPSSSFHMDTKSGSLNPYPGTNVTSPGSSSRAKLPDFQHRENNQNVGIASVGGPTKSTINMTTVPKFERPTFVNGPSRVQDGPISDFPKNSSFPLYSAPWQGSVTKDHTVGPSSSVIHVEHKLIDQSFEQAHKPRYLVQQGVTNVPLKQKNAIPISSNDDLEKQSSKMGLFTSTTSASSVFPSMTTQLDSSTMVTYKLYFQKTDFNLVDLLFKLIGGPFLFNRCCIWFRFAYILDHPGFYFSLYWLRTLVVKSKWTIYLTWKLFVYTSG